MDSCNELLTRRDKGEDTIEPRSGSCIMQWQPAILVNDVDVRSRCDEKVQALDAAFESAQVKTSA